MHERNRSSADAVGRRQREPTQMIRIAHFDDIGLELAQFLRPFPTGERNAIAGAERNFHSSHLEDARSGLGRFRTGHEQAVAHVGLLDKKAVFGQQITLHAAAVRREEQGEIGDVHAVPADGARRLGRTIAADA